MECMYCKYPTTHVVYTRRDHQIQTRRRRECVKCAMRFTTLEHLRKMDEEKYYREAGK